MPSRPATYDDLLLGQRFEAGPRVITRQDVARFADLSGDRTALHTDDEYASSTPFGGVVAHGALVLAAATGLAYESGVFEGTVLALAATDVAYDRPVRPGDELTLEMAVAALDERPRADRGRVRFAIRARNQHGKEVLSGHWSLVLRRRDPPPGPDA